MDSAVYLDHQSLATAIEVSDEAIDNLLTAEVQIVQLVSSQVFPQDLLLWSHGPAQFLGTPSFAWVDLLTPDDATCEQDSSSVNSPLVTFPLPLKGEGPGVGSILHVQVAGHREVLCLAGEERAPCLGVLPGHQVVHQLAG